MKRKFREAASKPDGLYVAASGYEMGKYHFIATEEQFLELLKACSDDKVKYINKDDLYKNYTVLMSLINSGRDWPKAAEALIKRGCPVNSKVKDGSWEDTPLTLCVQALIGSPESFVGETARVLLENGAKRDVKCDNGEGGKHTAAEFAKSEGKKKFASYLSGARRAPTRRRRRRRCDS